jgi:DNA-binding CsgD family transcriptional regulator
VAGLVPPTGLVIQKQGKEALRRHDEPHAQTVEHNEVHGLNLLAELFTEVLGVQRLPAAQKLNLAQAVLDDQSDAVLVVDPSGALQFANASAIRLIEISEVLALCGDRLSSPEPLIASSLRTLIRSASKAGRGGELSFPAEMPTYRGSVESLPGADVPLVCIRLRDEKARAAAQADRARLDHGLTLAETQLAEALLSGLTPVDIAERRNVSMSTVRTQLRSLYIKTGVTGQAELKKALDRP